jgi:hypothetical protein
VINVSPPAQVKSRLDLDLAYGSLISRVVDD